MPRTFSEAFHSYSYSPSKYDRLDAGARYPDQQRVYDAASELLRRARLSCNDFTLKIDREPDGFACGIVIEFNASSMPSAPELSYKSINAEVPKAGKIPVEHFYEVSTAMHLLYECGYSPERAPVSSVEVKLAEPEYLSGRKVSAIHISRRHAGDPVCEEFVSILNKLAGFAL
jgi:hypothetical protein